MLNRRFAFLLLFASACRQEDVKVAPTWELVLDVPSSVTAGEDVSYSLSAVSSEGETRELDRWTLQSDVEPALDWDLTRIRPVKASSQNIEVEGEVEELGEIMSTVATIAVRPGPPYSLSLDLSAHSGSYEVGDQILTDVTIKDAFGNETRDAWGLSVEGGDYSILDSSIWFEGDGIFTVRATVTDTDIYDEEGPILVDSHGPQFTMVFPQHVDTTGSTLGRVTGNVTDAVSGIQSATFDGDEIHFDENGDFQFYEGLDFGINVMTLQALDGDGNSTELVNTVLCGATLPYEEVVPEGVVVHLGDGAGGLGEITEGLDSVIEGIDVTSSLPIEIVGAKYDVAIVDVDYRFDGVEIDPIEDVIRATTSLSNIEVDIEGQVKALFWLDVTGSVNVDAVDVKVDLEPVVYASGEIGLRLDDTSVKIENLEMDFESSLFSVIESVGLDTALEEYVTNLLEDQIATAIQDAVTTQVEAALSSLTLDYSINVMDDVFQLSGEFERVEVGTDGITLGMDVSITLEDELEEPWIDGSLYAAYDPPDMSGLSGVAAGINLDLMNRILYLAWAMGGLDQTLTSEQIGLSSDALVLVFPEATSVTFSTEAMLPPVILPGDLLTPLEAQLGAMRLVAVDQNNDVLVDITVGGLMDVDLDVDGLTLTPSMTLVGDPWIEVTEVAEQSTGIVNYDALILLLLPQMVDNMAAAMQAVTLPSVSGSTLTINRVAPYGEEGGYLTAIGTMDL